MWPGTTRPTSRRGHGVRLRGGESGLIAKVARRLGIAPKAKSKFGAVVGRCPSHVEFDQLGFSSLGALVIYCEELSRRPRGKPLRSVVLPPEKRPHGVLKVVARRCKCGGIGAGCRACEGWGWGFTFHLGQQRCKHGTDAGRSALP